MGELHHFHVDTDPRTGSRLVVDGVDLSDKIAGLELAAGHGVGGNRLTLYVKPSVGSIDGYAVVEQIVAAPPGDAIRNIDPQLVRQLHAERGLGTLTDDPYAAMLDIVADLLDQAAGR